MRPVRQLFLFFYTFLYFVSSNLIKKTIKRLIGWTLQWVKIRRVLPVTKETRSLPMYTKTDINFDRVKICDALNG